MNSLEIEYFFELLKLFLKQYFLKENSKIINVLNISRENNKSTKENNLKTFLIFKMYTLIF